MARKNPNILLITCDQWRGDSLSSAGHPVVKTPNTDALAAQGVRFARHYAGAAPCSPARACLYTGLYQMTNRVCTNGTPLDARHDNIALAARRRGYDPTLFGYTDVSPDPRLHAPKDPVLGSYEGVLPGFTVRRLLPEHQKPWLSWLAGRGVDTSAGFPDIHRPMGGAGKTVKALPPVYSRDETPGAYLTGEFITWLGEQDRQAPWFAHLSFISPHPPFIAPAPYNTMYHPDDGQPFDRLETWQAEASSHPYLAFAMAHQKKSKFLPGMKGKVRDFSDQDFRQIRALYHGMISETDAQLGRIWKALKSARAWDDTIVILTSDHAELMGNHFMLGKGGFFDGGYHIPLIIRDPRSTKAAGNHVEHFTEAVDILPTFIDVLGGKPPAHLDGQSLKPFLEGKTPVTWRDAAHWEYDFRSIEKGTAERHFGLPPQQCNLAVIRTGRYKYVHFGGGLPPLLYDLEDDPGELRNRAEDPACLGIRLHLSEKMLAWRAMHLDQSLALSSLTDKGMAGSIAQLPARLG